MLADGVEAEVYSAEEGRKLLDTVTVLMSTVDAQLARLKGANLKPEDQQALDHTRRLAALLNAQTRELRSYWETGDKVYAAKFQKTRAEAWLGIKDLLGIKE